MSQKKFTFEKHDGYYVIKFDGALDFNNCKLFEEEIDGNSNYANSHIIVDCESFITLHQDWIRLFLKLKSATKLTGKMFKFIHVHKELQASFKRLGVDQSFKIAKDLKEVLDEVGITVKRTINTEFINPFLLATVHVLKIQAAVEATAGQIYMKKGSENLNGDVSGIIGIVSETFNGSVVISFPEKTFLRILSKMMGQELTKLDKSNVAGAGEITNMIFGNAKVVLNQNGYGIRQAIPRTKQGKENDVGSDAKAPAIVVPFETQLGEFFVEIYLAA